MMNDFNYKSFSDLYTDIRANIHNLYSYKFDLVVGIPRSGMIPAYSIALLLNISCTDFYSFLDNRPLNKGRRSLVRSIDFPHDAQKILVVDDSIFTGKSMSNALNLIPEKLKQRIVSLAVYSSNRERKDVDIFFLYLPLPRLFEWNLFHRNVITQACVDIDGVLCFDPTQEENDDGEKYLNFIKAASPLFLPGKKIHSLVTNRLEKYRAETEKWLDRHNIKYTKLIMLDLPSKEERIRQKAHVSHKVDYYKTSTTRLFIESSSKQAEKICRYSGKPVYCVENNTMYNPNFRDKILYNKKILLSEYLLEKIRKRIKWFLQFF